MPTINFPNLSLQRRSDVIKLADWMEVNALVEKDRSSSIEDVISEIKIARGEDYKFFDELRADLSSLLIQRGKELNEAYPFEFNGMLLNIKGGNFQKKWTYIFCLLISYIGVEKIERDFKIWKILESSSIFEKICTLAAKVFLSGKSFEAEALQFGAPRKEWVEKDRPFKAALKILKNKIKDGEIKKIGNTSVRKDAGLDVVAWRDFPDKKRSKLLLFGQCTTSGKDYNSKKRELNEFFVYFRIDSTNIKSFFIPHSLEEDRWSIISCDPSVGLVFDRNRIAWYAKDWEGEELKKTIDLFKKKLSD